MSIRRSNAAAEYQRAVAAGELVAGDPPADASAEKPGKPVSSTPKVKAKRRRK